ncbi:UNVERIFIED_CONTAM: Alpha carbonic anhydrase 7, partial [Sesamum latifolium]
DETSFSYVVGAKDGPENWGNLNPNWRLCGTGKTQSPINIVDCEVNVTWSLGDFE